MGKIIKKCLACGTLNQYDAQVCKKCECTLLADVDQDDEILSIDPMEAALDDAVSEASEEDDMVAQILREQAETARQIVAKEKAKEERKKKTSGSTPFSVSSEAGSRFSGFSIKGSDSSTSYGSARPKSSGTSGGTGGFRISDGTKEEFEPGRVHLRSGSLRMQAIRQNQAKGNDSSQS